VLVEPVIYDEFGSHLFELVADGEAVACGRPVTDRLACDVTVFAAGTDGRIRLRLRFERSADDGGSQDPRCSSSPTRNTNESGIFTFELS
jgi:hypothetical protein